MLDESGLASFTTTSTLSTVCAATGAARHQSAAARHTASADRVLDRLDGIT
jgi:hypothetical protein